MGSDVEQGAVTGQALLFEGGFAETNIIRSLCRA